jgi:hypothetical protein
MGFEPTEFQNDLSRQFGGQMKQIHEEAHAAIQLAQGEMKQYADRKRAEAPKYKEGEKVWLSVKDYSTDRESEKLAEKWVGPYLITKVVSPLAMELELPKTWRIHNVIHVSKLRPYKPSTIPGQASIPQPPIQVDDHEEWEVEEILNSRHRYGKLEYLIKWKGFTAEHNTWEPWSNALNAPKAITKFHKKNGKAHRIHIFKLEWSLPVDERREKKLWIDSETRS